MIYVDDTSPTIPSSVWPWHSGAHLFADTPDELHGFALSMGISKDYIGSNPNFPHYMVNARNAERAIQRGARRVPASFVDRFINPRKKVRK